jgi:uncharacterized protein YjiS (DUF1127 family)
MKMNRSGFGAVADRVADAWKWRETRRAVAHLPDHLLRDIGLRRDWRGRVVRLPEGFR